VTTSTTGASGTTDAIGTTGVTGTADGGAGGDARPALARCLSVPPEEFAATYWSRRPLLSPAATLPRDFSDLLDAAAVDELLSERGLRTPFLRLAKQGRVLSSGDFTRSGGLGATIGDQVADDKVLAQFQLGATLVLQGLHRVWPPLIEFSQQLSSDLGHPVQVNAYVTPAENQGFAAHYDVHDVLVLQVAGEKHWSIHAPVHEHPLADQPWTERRAAVAARALEEPVIDTVLRPGDALYLPRGWLHSAEALGETTIHLTVGLHTTTRHDVLQALLALAADSPALRESLPIGAATADATELQAQLDLTVKLLTDRLGAATGRDAVDAIRRRADRTTRPEPLGPLAQLDAIRSLTPNTRIRLRRHAQARVEDDKEGENGQPREVDQVWLRTSVGAISRPDSDREVLLQLLDGRAHRVGDLMRSDGATGDGLDLARTLLSEGLVVPA
jgi:lysine-specific demethylase/histidyl-hydroxylase NO66